MKLKFNKKKIKIKGEQQIINLIDKQKENKFYQ